MSWGISASPSSLSYLPPQQKIKITHCSSSSSFSFLVPNYNTFSKLRSFDSSSHSKLGILPGGEFARLGVVVQCSSHNNTPEGGDNGSKSVLDAFFLGKALAEAINERVESTVGELLSTVGRLQAEQQKKVLDFQDEVLERAKKAKEKAAREAMEAQGNVSSSAATTVSSEVVAVEISPSSSSSEQINNTNNNDPLLRMMMDDD